MPTCRRREIFYKLITVYREERVRIRNSEIDCRMRMYDNLQYQSIIVRFERIVSGRFSPLTAPLPLTRPPAPLRSRSPALPYFFKFRSRPAPLPLIRFSGPLRSIFRSMFCNRMHGAMKKDSAIYASLYCAVDTDTNHNVCFSCYAIAKCGIGLSLCV